MMEHRNPPGLASPIGYSQVIRSTGSTLVSISGQFSTDDDGTIVSVDDLAGQVRQAHRNLITALAAFGATMDDVVKTTLFLTDLTQERVDIVSDVRAEFIPTAREPASVLIGVAALTRPGLEFGIDALAHLE